MDVPKDRQDYIDSLVDRLRQNYRVPLDWHRVAVDHNIKYVIDNRFVVPVSAKTEAGRLSVGVQENAATSFGNWSRAHEFGHLLLGHLDSSLSRPLREQEADYFAKRFLGKDFEIFDAYSQIFLNVLMHPLLSLVVAFGPRHFYNNYALSILKR